MATGFGSFGASAAPAFGSMMGAPAPTTPAGSMQMGACGGGLGGGGLGLGQPGLGQVGAARSPVDEYRERITVIYQQHNPSKLGEIENLLVKYKDKENELYLKVCKKYNVTPTPGPAAGAPLGAGGAFAAPSGGAAGAFG